MASKWYKIEGKIKWANSQYGGLFEPDPKYGYYKAQIYPSPSGWEAFKKAGLQIKTYTDDDGDYILLKRTASKIIKGELTKFGRPKVFFLDSIEPTKDIGNLSVVEASVCVYDTVKGPGHRLESITVNELVLYDRDTKGTPSNLRELREENEDNVQEPDSNDDSGSTSDGVFNDPIPFGSPKGSEEGTGRGATDTKPTKGTKSPFRRTSA